MHSACPVTGFTSASLHFTDPEAGGVAVASAPVAYGVDWARGEEPSRQASAVSARRDASVYGCIAEIADAVVSAQTSITESKRSPSIMFLQLAHRWRCRRLLFGDGVAVRLLHFRIANRMISNAVRCSGRGSS